MAISRLTLPSGFDPTIVPFSGVSTPLSPIANPAMVDVPAFDAYTRLPSGLIAFQQLAAPSVSTLWLTTPRVPSGCTVYDEIADPLGILPGPVSETISLPSGAN